MTTYPLSPAVPESPPWWTPVVSDVVWYARHLLDVADEVFVTAAAVIATIYQQLRRVPRECWPPIACAGFAVFCGYMALVGMLADTRSWGETFQPLLTTAGLVVGAPIVLALGAVLGGHTGHAHDVAGCAGKVHYARGNSDSARRALMQHEKAHQQVCAKAGGGGSTVSIRPTSDGGWAGVTKFHNPGKVAKLAPERQVAIHLAGITRRPDTDSPNDIPNAKAAAGGSREVMKQGQKLASRWV